MIRPALALILTLGAGAALAEDMAAMPGMAQGADGAMGGYMAAMDTMNTSMTGMESTGSADADFLMMMIPHHQSAIDMAKVELEMGQDEATKAMAQAIIDAQTAEIAQMTAMLTAMGHPMP